MLLFREKLDSDKLAGQQADLRTYRIVEAVLAAAGHKAPKHGELFPSLKDLGMADEATDVDPEQSFKQIKNTLGQFSLFN